VQDQPYKRRGMEIAGSRDGRCALGLAMDDPGRTSDRFPLCVRLWRVGHAEGRHSDQRSHGLGCEFAPFNTETCRLLAHDLAFNRHPGSFAIHHGRELDFDIGEQTDRQWGDDERAADADVGYASARCQTAPCPEVDGPTDFAPMSPTVFHVAYES
jgi:hypothetical protein